MSEARFMDTGLVDGTIQLASLSKGWRNRSRGELWDNIHSDDCRQTWRN